MCALLFLYRNVLNDPLPWLDDIVRARRSRRLPVVLTRAEVRLVVGGLSGTPRLVASLLYGGGLRLLEALRLRVKDIDLAASLLIVRQGKGAKDRRTILPESVKQPLRLQIEDARRLHQRDLARGLGEVALPDALDRKYRNAAKEFAWQYVFPSSTLCRPGERDAAATPSGRVGHPESVQAGRVRSGESLTTLRLTNMESLRSSSLPGITTQQVALKFSTCFGPCRRGNARFWLQLAK